MNINTDIMSEYTPFYVFKTNQSIVGTGRQTCFWTGSWNPSQKHRSFLCVWGFVPLNHPHTGYSSICRAISLLSSPVNLKVRGNIKSIDFWYGKASPLLSPLAAELFVIMVMSPDMGKGYYSPVDKIDNLCSTCTYKVTHTLKQKQWWKCLSVYQPCLLSSALSD